MTDRDIVERLRACEIGMPMDGIREAADEIERLRAESRALRNAAVAHAADIERLQAALAAAMEDTAEVAQLLHAEIERLRAENARLRASASAGDMVNADALIKIERLRAAGNRLADATGSSSLDVDAVHNEFCAFEPCDCEARAEEINAALAAWRKVAHG